MFGINKKKRSLILKNQGDFYDIKEIFNRVNVEYFEGKIDLHITWFGNRHSKPRTRIILGSYNQQKRLIKIHRILDQAHIPDHYVSFIIYHEMLHHVLPPVWGKRRRRKIHHPEFKEREKQFQHYLSAKEFGAAFRMSLFPPLKERIREAIR